MTVSDSNLFNFNKNGEVYNYTPATDTNIIYRTEDEKSFIIKSKGGGNGGCGYYNRNSNLDGGCGGGSGIDKKNGKAIIDPSFNGNDGAVGTYCGGGGGIISAGNNNYGGKGKIIDWFNDNLVFGAGGNGAGTKEDRKLGYGSGGNGAECCQFSKLNIDNDGNNGCVLIYLKPVITEKFTDSGRTTTYYDDNSIINKLLSESFSLFNNTDANSIAGNIDRKMYFTSIGQTFANLCYNDDITLPATPPPLSLVGGDNNMNNFIYDMLVASKLFAVIYRLYYHQFKVTNLANINTFNTFLSSAKIKFTSDSSQTDITNSTTVNINKLFDIENLKLSDNITDYKTNVYCASAYLNMDSNAYNKTLEDIGNNIEVPFYHYSSNNSNYSIPGLSNWYAENYSTANKIFVNKINPIVTGNSDSISITTYSNSNCASPLTSFASLAVDIDPLCSASSAVIIPLNNTTTSTYLTKDRLKEIYTLNKSLLNGSIADKDNYSKQRILFHLENFNIILNTDANIMLSTLKYYMYYYNAVVYNVILQYDLFKLQQLRITNFKGGIQTAYNRSGENGHLYTDSGKYDTSGNPPVYGYNINPNLATDNGAPKTYFDNTNTDIAKFGSNLINTYTSINASTKYIEMVKKINSNTSDINSISSEFDKYQTNYNKVVNIYNNDLDNYKTINNYYRAVIVIAIVIIVIAIFIFSIPNIDGNAQTGILLITSVIMIIFYAFYLVNLKSTETFINCNYKNAADGINNYGANLDFSTYKQNLLTYNTFLMVMASGFSSTGDTLTPINDFVDQANLMRRRRILFYKTKIAEYTHASELLKKSADDYYYLMTLIYFSIIIALVAMAFYLLFPTMIFTVIIFAILIFLILLIFIVYRINRSTRLFNDKNYWANFNPTPEVIQSL